MSFLPALFGIARFAIRKWSNAKRVPDREQAKNSGAAQIIQTVAARALSDRRQRSRLLQGYGGASLNSSQFAMSSRCRYRKLRCQSRKFRGRKPEHKVIRKTVAVTLDGFVKAKRGDAIDAGEVSIQYDLLSSNRTDEFVESRAIGQLFPLSHDRRSIIS